LEWCRPLKLRGWVTGRGLRKIGVVQTSKVKGMGDRKRVEKDWSGADLYMVRGMGDRKSWFLESERTE
jgi:hypothetical protein